MQNGAYIATARLIAKLHGQHMINKNMATEASGLAGRQNNTVNAGCIRRKAR